MGWSIYLYRLPHLCFLTFSVIVTPRSTHLALAHISTTFVWNILMSKCLNRKKSGLKWASIDNPILCFQRISNTPFFNNPSFYIDYPQFHQYMFISLDGAEPTEKYVISNKFARRNFIS